MSFGYGIGDFIAGANLSYRLIQALSSTKGASIEYQEALMELGSIQQCFLQVGRMTENPNLNLATVNAASHIVLSSMDMIGNFLTKTKRYREVARVENEMSDSWQKMGWVLFKKEELKALRDAFAYETTEHIGVTFCCTISGDTSQRGRKIPSQSRFRNAVLSSKSQPGNRAPHKQSELEPEMQQGDYLQPSTKLIIVEDEAFTEPPDLSKSEENDDNWKRFSGLEAVVVKWKAKQKGLQRIKFKDALNRNFEFPFEIARTWDGFESLVRKAFDHIDILGPLVATRQYDLVGPNMEIILPQIWETMIQPEMSIAMLMWPMPKPQSRPPRCRPSPEYLPPPPRGRPSPRGRFSPRVCPPLEHLPPPSSHRHPRRPPSPSSPPSRSSNPQNLPYESSSLKIKSSEEISRVFRGDKNAELKKGPEIGMNLDMFPGMWSKLSEETWNKKLKTGRSLKTREAHETEETSSSWETETEPETEDENEDENAKKEMLGEWETETETEDEKENEKKEILGERRLRPRTRIRTGIDMRMQTRTRTRMRRR